MNTFFDIVLIISALIVGSIIFYEFFFGSQMFGPRKWKIQRWDLTGTVVEVRYYRFRWMRNYMSGRLIHKQKAKDGPITIINGSENTAAGYNALREPITGDMYTTVGKNETIDDPPEELQ